MSNPRREHFAYLRRISAGDDPRISHAAAVASARVYHRAWAATDRLLAVPSIEVDPDGGLVCKWTRDQFELEVYFTPDSSPFWSSGVLGDVWGGDAGDCWDAGSSLSIRLKEDFDRIVGREPARPAPPPPPPPHRPGLLKNMYECIFVVLPLAAIGGIGFGKVVPGAYWFAAICGGIWAASFAGSILWFTLSEVRADRRRVGPGKR
jgi:hypothetical protein